MKTKIKQFPNHKMWSRGVLVLALLGLFGFSFENAPLAHASGPTTVNLPATFCQITNKDISITPSSCDNGSDLYVYATDTASGPTSIYERTVVEYDLSSIPSNATVTSSTLSLSLTSVTPSFTWGAPALQVYDLGDTSAVSSTSPTWLYSTSSASWSVVGGNPAFKAASKTPTALGAIGLTVTSGLNRQVAGTDPVGLVLKLDPKFDNVPNTRESGGTFPTPDGFRAISFVKGSSTPLKVTYTTP